MKYSIIPFDLKGSVKPFDHHGRIQEIDLDLPEGAIPISFDIIIKDRHTGDENIDWSFYSITGIDELQREWLDDAHTEFTCVIDGKLKRYLVITRVYCMLPKSAGVQAPEVPVKLHSAVASSTWRVDNSKLIEDIKQDLNAVVDSKDRSEVLRLIESAKEKLDSLDIDPQVVGIIKAMGTPQTAEIIHNPTQKSLGDKVFPLLNDGFNVFIKRQKQEPFSIVVTPFTKVGGELYEEDTNPKPMGVIPVHLNPTAYIGTNIKEGTTDVSIQIQHVEGAGKCLVVVWKDGQHHEVRFPIYLLEAQHEHL